MQATVAAQYIMRLPDSHVLLKVIIDMCISYERNILDGPTKHECNGVYLPLLLHRPMR